MSPDTLGIKQDSDPSRGPKGRIDPRQIEEWKWRDETAEEIRRMEQKYNQAKRAEYSKTWGAKRERGDYEARYEDLQTTPFFWEQKPSDKPKARTELDDMFSDSDEDLFVNDTYPRRHIPREKWTTGRVVSEEDLADSLDTRIREALTADWGGDGLSVMYDIDQSEHGILDLETGVEETVRDMHSREFTLIDEVLDAVKTGKPLGKDSAFFKRSMQADPEQHRRRQVVTSFSYTPYAQTPETVNALIDLARKGLESDEALFTVQNIFKDLKKQLIADRAKGIVSEVKGHISAYKTAQKMLASGKTLKAMKETLDKADKLIEIQPTQTLSTRVERVLVDRTTLEGEPETIQIEEAPNVVKQSNQKKKAEIERLAKDFGLRLGEDINLVLTDSPKDWGLKGYNEESKQPGVWNPDKQTAYFALDNMISSQLVEQTFVHEIGVHYGLPRVMGAESWSKFLENVRESFPVEFNGLKQEMIETEKNAKRRKFLEENSDDANDLIAEELVAVMADQNYERVLREGSDPSTFLSRLDALRVWVRNVLRSIPGVGKWFKKLSSAEMRGMIRRAMSGLKDTPKWTREGMTLEKGLQRDDFKHVNDGEFDSLRAVYRDKPKKYTISNLKETFKNRAVASIFDALKPIESKLGKDEYILARLARRAEGVMTAILEYGGIRVTQDRLTDPRKKYLSLDVDMKKKSLFEILKPLGTDAERKQFFAWLAFNRADKLKGTDRENYFTDDQIRNGLNLNRGNAKNALTGVIGNRSSLYNSISKQYGDWNSDVVDVAVKFGLLKAETARNWEKQFYVPFFREFENDAGQEGVVGPANYAGLVNQQTVKKLKGSPDPIHDPFDNILLNSLHLVDASLKNYAAKNAIDSALKTIDPATGEPIAKVVGKNAKGAVRIQRDGIQEHYLISDNLLLESLSSQHYQDVSFPGMKWAMEAKRLFTWGTTIGAPFKIRNAIRDTVSTAGVTNIGYNVFDNFFGGMGRLKDREMKARMLVNGAYIQFGHLSSGNADFARKTFEKNIDQRYVLNNPTAQDNLAGSFKRYGRMARQIFGRYEDWGNELENANRASLFQHEALKRGSNLLAAFHARDILDFSLSGSSTTVRMFNQLLPFTNARLQGLYKMGRSAKHDPKTFWTVGGAVMLGSILNYLQNKDDEDWKDREEWDKDTYYWFKVPGTDTAFRVPTPHEFGFMGNVAWRSYAAVFDEDPIHRHLYAERMVALLGHELALDPTPQLIKPLKEVMADKVAFTGRHIEGPALQRLSTTERKRLWTTQTAIGASEALNQIPWEKVQLSPVQVEHVVKGYFGWLGQIGLFISDLIVRSVGDYPVQPGRRLNEWPVAKDFFQTTPIKNTTYGNIFYEQLKEIEQTYADIRLYQRLGQFERAAEMEQNNREKLYLRKILNRRQDIVQELNNRIKVIQVDRWRSSKQKRIEVDRLEQIRNTMLRSTVRGVLVAD